MKEKFENKKEAGFGRAGKSRRAFQGSAAAPSLRDASAPFQSLSHLFNPKKIPSEALEILNNFDEIIESALHLTSRQKASLSHDIKNLSHNLTDTRGNRRVGYMNSPSEVSAYVHYFLWWNLVRLVPLFANLPENAFDLKDEDVALDIGSGPLTVPIALWLSRPELRSKKIKFYCVDLSQNALSTGEELFLSVCAKTSGSPWQIVRVKGELGTEIKEKASLITSANVFNEVIQNETKTLEFLAKKNCEGLLKYTCEKSKILVIEPGIPRSARFISLLRDSFVRKDFSVISPCPHWVECPMQGRTPLGKAQNKAEKWCNFGFSTEHSPKKLLKLSEKSNLPKDRVVLSFVFVEKGNSGAEKNGSKGKIELRVASEPIFLPFLQKKGVYCCSEKGLVLYVPKNADEKHFPLRNGELFEIPDFNEEKSLRDRKTDAIIVK